MKNQNNNFFFDRTFKSGKFEIDEPGKIVLTKEVDHSIYTTIYIDPPIDSVKISTLHFRILEMDNESCSLTVGITNIKKPEGIKIGLDKGSWGVSLFSGIQIYKGN